jgi:hypothetical protein
MFKKKPQDVDVTLHGTRWGGGAIRDISEGFCAFGRIAWSCTMKVAMKRN